MFTGIVLAASLASLLGTRLVRSLAWRFGWIAPPRGDRWHKQATALHGGLGFYPVFLVGALLVLLYSFRDPVWRLEGLAGLPASLRLALAMLVGSLTMFILGHFDDTSRFRPATKLLFQIIAASIFIYAGGMFHLTNIYVLDLLVTYIWFIGIINSINMLDNMDGLASGVAILAAATLVYMGGFATGVGDQPVLAVPLGLVLIGVLFGFWLYNRPPASIFMGDSGSLFIGFVLAALAIPSALNGSFGIHATDTLLGPLMVLLIPATVLAIPIFDTTLVTLTRTMRSQRAFDGGQDHSSHRLVVLGISERRSVWLMYGLAAFGGACAILMQRLPDLSISIFGVFALVLVFTGIYLGHVKVKEVSPRRLPRAWTPFVSSLLYKRHAVEVLLDTSIIALSMLAAYLLRFEGELAPAAQSALVWSLPLVVASCLIVFALSGIYRGQWGLISVADVPRFALSAVGGTVLSIAVVTLATRFGEGHSRSAYMIFGMLLFLSLVGTRLSFRLLDSIAMRLRSRPGESDQQRVLIYGAGSGGKMLYEFLAGNPNRNGYVTNDTLEDPAIIGFVDDDPYKAGRYLCGLPIRNAGEWSSQQWRQAPEIWISSRHISNKAAWEVARHWNGEAKVRRMKLQVDLVEDGVAAALLGPEPQKD